MTDWDDRHREVADQPKTPVEPELLLDDEPTSEAPWPRAPKDSEPVEEKVEGTAPVTVSFSVDEFLHRLIPDYHGEPTNIRDELLQIVAHKITQDVMRAGDIREMARDAIRQGLDALVQETLTETYQKVNTYGMKDGEPTTLREEIIAQATKHLAEAMSPADKYGDSRIKGSVRKFIADEVDRVFMNELKAASETAKQKVIATVQEKGAEFLAQAFAEAATKVNTAVPTKTIGNT